MNSIEKEGRDAVRATNGDDRSALDMAIFITWERHRRTRGLAQYFGITVKEIVVAGSRWRRCPAQLLETARTVIRTPATTIVVQNPSLILSLFAVLWRMSLGRGRRLVVDAHNQAVAPFLANNWIIRTLSRFVIKNADLTLVTNSALSDKVRVMGGRACVLPDRLPDMHPRAAMPLEENRPMRVLVVATYAPDEPIEAVLRAAARSGPGYEFAFTGNSRRLPTSLHALAGANVKFLGFLDDSTYWQAMADAHVVLDLTLMPDCLVCGAYEAVAIGRPMILSDTEAQRAHFRDAARYTIPEKDAIADCLGKLREDYAIAVDQVKRRREEMTREWRLSADRVAECIKSLT